MPKSLIRRLLDAFVGYEHKTVASVTSAFHKVVADLHQVEAETAAEIEEVEEAIAEFTEHHANLSAEKEKAAQVKAKIRELIGEL